MSTKQLESIEICVAINNFAVPLFTASDLTVRTYLI